jgi:hypothetical protein
MRRSFRTLILAVAMLASTGMVADVASAAPPHQSAALMASPIAPTKACPPGYYRNSSGKCVHRPVTTPKAPNGATAKCRDGTYSFSQHRSGTCSGHKGVGAWL